jgi:hypothetical protein
MATAMETRRRVKLYQLDDEGKWEDKGTGQIACNFMEVSLTLYLFSYSILSACIIVGLSGQMID